MAMLDPENFVFQLKSCTVKDDGVTIDGKGGKFTTFHDGISYYYTVVDPTIENFELTATFTVDYINSISYNNTNGITSNSNPGVVLENDISYGNKGTNLSLYGKGSGDRNFVVD